MHKLIRLAQESHLSLSDTQAEQLDLYMELLLEWNQKMNLTGITEPEEVYVKHFIDSLSVLQKDWIPEEAKVIDVGSGAGFPGLPLAIVRPDLTVVYADSLQKRLRFINEVIEKLNIKQNILVHGRAEDLGRDKAHREQYDLAVARAVAPMAILAEYTLPFVKPGGSLIAWKGPKASEEIREAEAAIRKLGGKTNEVFSLTVQDMERVLVRVDKIKPTPARYPRKPRAIKDKPLSGGTQ